MENGIYNGMNNSNSNYNIQDKMKDSLDKNVYIYLAFGIIALVVVIIFLVITFKKANTPSTLVEPKYADDNTGLNDGSKGNGQSNISDLNESEKRTIINEAIKKRGIDSLPRLDRLDYTSLAKVQFAEPNEKQDKVVIRFNGYDKPVSIKLFNELAPNTVKEFENAIEKGYFDNKQITMETFADLIIPAVDENNNGIFANGNNDELNYSLVPYKGALVYNYKATKYGEAAKDFSIVMEDLKDVNLNVVDKMALNYTIKNELKNRGGRLENVYLKNIVFGQVYEGLDVLEQIVKDYIELKQTDSLNPSSQNIGTYISDISIVRSDDIK